MTLYGFVVKGDTRETAYDTLLNDNSAATIGEAQFYLYVTQTLLGDGFMVRSSSLSKSHVLPRERMMQVYRLFIVWINRRAVVVVPAILFFIDLGEPLHYFQSECALYGSRLLLDESL